MKTLIMTLFMVLFATSGSIMAQDAAYELLEKSTMKISGTSTIHDWTADVETLNTSININEELLKSDTTARAVTSFSLTIPVKSIESGKGGMNSKIYGALKEKKHPNITFKLSSVETVKSLDTESRLNVGGNLTIAGVSRNISLLVQGAIMPEGTLKYTGEYEINMKDYDIDPPSAMFGTIRSGEKITVSFELYFGRK